METAPQPWQDDCSTGWTSYESNFVVATLAEQRSNTNDIYPLPLEWGTENGYDIPYNAIPNRRLLPTPAAAIDFCIPVYSLDYANVRHGGQPSNAGVAVSAAYNPVRKQVCCRFVRVHVRTDCQRGGSGAIVSARDWPCLANYFGDYVDD